MRVLSRCVGGWLAVLFPLALGSGAAHAQGPGQGRASVSGTVFDSLITNAPLGGAEVTLEGTALTALSDASGRFRIDGVPPGRATLRFYHPRLDSLGFGAAPVAVAVGDSGTVTVRLATPSAATLHASLCSGTQPQSTGLLLGRVRDVDTRAPLASATVSVNWSEWTLGAGALVRNERRASATTDANGAYRLCGVPTDVAVVARATGADHVTGLVEVDFAQRLFDVHDFVVSLADSGAMTAHLARLDSAVARGDSVRLDGSATITGTVRSPDQKPLANAQVALYGFPLSVETNSNGVFGLTRVPAGSQTIDVRAVGFAPQRVAIELATGQRRTLDVTVARAAQTLASVNIVGQGARVDFTGFEQRRKAGTGQYITEEDLNQRGVFETTQALWNVTGARVIWNGWDNVLMLTRPLGSGVGGGSYNTLCAPTYWIDGFALPTPSERGGDNEPNVNNFVRPRDIRGIEVYLDPSSAPPQYREPGARCGVVLIWTRPRQPNRPARGKP